MSESAPGQQPGGVSPSERPAQALGGPCRVETEWAEVNSGLTYTEQVQGGSGGSGGGGSGGSGGGGSSGGSGSGGRGGMTLLQWYASTRAASASAAQWRSSIEGGSVSINGQVVHDPGALIPPGATLEHRRPAWAEPPAPAFLDVLWYDEHLVAVHKPSGLQVLPAGPFHERCALSLLRQFHQQHAAELAGMPAPVHRLGRGTSGVLICACSEAARRGLSADFVQHGGANSGCMRKVYRTLVAGLVPQDEGEVDVPIGKMAYPGVRGGLFAACAVGAAGAKPSRSRYRVLHRDAAAGTSLVDVEIFTGRPHQIRIHMAAAGHPLVGDPLYAPGGLPWPLPAQQDARAASSSSGGAADAAAPAGSPVGAAAAAERAAAAAAAAAAGLPDTGEKEGRQSAAHAPERQQAGSSGSTAQPPQPSSRSSSRPTGAASLNNTGSRSSSGCSGGGRRAVMPGDCGYLLHSMVLEFNHPVTGERIAATCPPPPALRLPD